MFCANCGISNSDSARFCAKCGTALGGSAATVVSAAGAGAPAAPAGLRRDGDLLIVPRGATLPPYCVKCGQPAAKFINKNFGWHNPLLYLLVLINILVYAVVAAIVMKRMKVDVPLCADHLSRRSKFLWAGWGLLVGAIPVGIIIGMMGNNDESAGIGVAVGLLCFLASLILLIVGYNLMRPKLIDDAQATFVGVSPAFLQYIGTRAPAVPAAPAAIG